MSHDPLCPWHDSAAAADTCDLCARLTQARQQEHQHTQRRIAAARAAEQELAAQRIADTMLWMSLTPNARLTIMRALRTAT